MVKVIEHLRCSWYVLGALCGVRSIVWQRYLEDMDPISKTGLVVGTKTENR